MSSRSATVLVIFVVACVAFCLATVFASMTGPISILPNESESGGILDNLSVIENADTGDYQSYDSSNDYSSSYDDSQSSEPQVETTTDDSADQSSNSPSSDSGHSSDDSGSSDVGSDDQIVETTKDGD